MKEDRTLRLLRKTPLTGANRDGSKAAKKKLAERRNETPIAPERLDGTPVAPKAGVVRSANRPQALERRNDPSPRAHAGIWSECPISRRTSFSPADRIYRARVAFSRNLALAGRKIVPRDAFPDTKQNSRNEAAWTYFSTYLTWPFTDSQLLSWHYFNQIREIRARQRLKGQIRDPWLEYSARNSDSNERNKESDGDAKRENQSRRSQSTNGARQSEMQPIRASLEPAKQNTEQGTFAEHCSFETRTGRGDSRIAEP